MAQSSIHYTQSLLLCDLHLLLVGLASLALGFCTGWVTSGGATEVRVIDRGEDLNSLFVMVVCSLQGYFIVDEPVASVRIIYLFGSGNLLTPRSLTSLVSKGRVV